MNSTIHFDTRAVRSVEGGIVVSFDTNRVPSRAEVIETAAVVTITVFDERAEKRHRFGRFARHEVFIPLCGLLGPRTVIDGSLTPEPALLLAS
jgi:hypothetical protein